MDIYVIRQEQETGPYSLEAVRGLLAEGAVAPDAFAWQEGLPQWIPLGDLLGTAAEADAQEAAAPETGHVDPATAKQKALLSFLGIALPAELTRDQAALMVNDALEDLGKAERLALWNEERLRLHPDLFAAEIEAKKANRAAYFLELCHSTGAEYFSGVTKAHCQVLVGFLDVKFPHWDARESEAAEHYFFPAVAEKFPQLVHKTWRGRLQYADSPKPPRTTRQSGTSKLRSSGTSVLAAVTRGVLLGLVILAALYFAHRTMNRTTTASPAAEVSVAPPSTPIPPSTDPTPPAAPPDLPVIEPLPSLVPAVTAPAPSAPLATTTPGPANAPEPTVAASAPPIRAPDPITAPTPEPVAPMAVVDPTIPPVAPMSPTAPVTPDASAVATAPMAALPGAEPAVFVPPPLPAMPMAPGEPTLPPEAAAIPPLSPGELPPAAPTLPAAKTNLVLTKPVEAQLTYGKVTLPPGTPVRLLERQGAALRVSYGASILVVPATSTDAE